MATDGDASQRPDAQAAAAAVDGRFVEQFIRSGGPELALRALAYYKETSSGDMTSACLLPLLAVGELREGRRWVEQHYDALAEHLSTFAAEIDSLDYPDAAMRGAVAALWGRFRAGFASIQAAQAELAGAELVATEEREKARRERKREKRRQKRLLQRTKDAQMTALVATTAAGDGDVTATEEALEGADCARPPGWGGVSPTDSSAAPAGDANQRPTIKARRTKKKSSTAVCQTAGGQTTVCQTAGGQTAAGGQTSVCQTTGGQTTVCQTAGGQTAAGGQTSVCQMAGGQTTVCQAAGGQTIAWQTVGGETAGGQEQDGQTETCGAEAVAFEEVMPKRRVKQLKRERQQGGGPPVTDAVPGVGVDGPAVDDGDQAGDQAGDQTGDQAANQTDTGGATAADTAAVEPQPATGGRTTTPEYWDADEGHVHRDHHPPSDDATATDDDSSDGDPPTTTTKQLPEWRRRGAGVTPPASGRPERVVVSVLGSTSSDRLSDRPTVHPGSTWADMLKGALSELTISPAEPGHKPTTTPDCPPPAGAPAGRDVPRVDGRQTATGAPLGVKSAETKPGGGEREEANTDLYESSGARKPKNRRLLRGMTVPLQTFLKLERLAKDDLTAGKPERPAKDDVTAGKLERSAKDDVTAGKPERSAKDDVTAGKPERSVKDDVTAGKLERPAKNDVTAGKLERPAKNDVTAGKLERPAKNDVTAGKPERRAKDDVTAGKLERSAKDDVIAGKLEWSAKDDVTAGKLERSAKNDVTAGKPERASEANSMAPRSDAAATSDKRNKITHVSPAPRGDNGSDSVLSGKAKVNLVYAQYSERNMAENDRVFEPIRCASEDTDVGVRGSSPTGGTSDASSSVGTPADIRADTGCTRKPQTDRRLQPNRSGNGLNQKDCPGMTDGGRAGLAGKEGGLARTDEAGEGQTDSELIDLRHFIAPDDVEIEFARLTPDPDALYDDSGDAGAYFMGVRRDWFGGGGRRFFVPHDAWTALVEAQIGLVRRDGVEIYGYDRGPQRRRDVFGARSPRRAREERTGGGRMGDGRAGDGRVGERRTEEGRMGDCGMGEGRVGNGRVGDSSVGLAGDTPPHFWLPASIDADLSSVRPTGCSKSDNDDDWDDDDDDEDDDELLAIAAAYVCREWRSQATARTKSAPERAHAAATTATLPPPGNHPRQTTQATLETLENLAAIASQGRGCRRGGEGPHPRRYPPANPGVLPASARSPVPPLPCTSRWREKAEQLQALPSLMKGTFGRIVLARKQEDFTIDQK